MTHWRNRVGEESLQKLLQESLYTGLKVKAIKAKDLRRVAVDTTVQEKAITFPTDAKLSYKAIKELGKTAEKEWIKLRQSYVYVGKTESINRYRLEVESLKSWTRSPVLC